MNALKSATLLRTALLFLLGCWLGGSRVAAQHGHLYAGVMNPGPGQPLWFQNGSLWDTNSYGGYPMSPACIYFQDDIPDLYPGLYQTAVTFAALPATIFNAGPSPFAAALGTFIELRLVSLEGPEGGVLTVWNEIDDPTQPAVMFTVPVGTREGTNRIVLSEGDPADPSADPYGHIHGRRFTLNRPGLYTVGLQLVDTSANGPDGGPVQSPSAVTYFYLQAGLCLSDFSRSDTMAAFRFGLPGFTDYVVESSPTVVAPNWTPVTNVTGTTHSELRWVTDPAATSSSRFYRVRETAN